MAIIEDSELVARVRDAAIQLRYMQPWLEDRRFESEGGHIIYAVDADVFHAYGAPDKRAGVELGQVFFDDDPALSAALAQRLSDHIFFRASPERPLLIAPPIEKDVASILNGLMSRLGTTDPPAIDLDVGNLRLNVETLRERGIMDADPNAIYELVLRLLYLQTGDAATFRALTRLIILDRVAGPDLIGDLENDPEVSNVLRPFERLEDIYDHLSLRNELITGLTEHHELGARRRENRERDADCLARIAIWNRKLQRANTKILYITATPPIHDLSQKSGSEISFIRHPRYFLASESVFHDLHPTDLPLIESAFFGWLYTLVGNIANVKRFEEKQPRKLNRPFFSAILRAEELRPDASAEIKEGWFKFTRGFREAYLPPQETQEQLLLELGQVVDGIRTVQEWYALRDELNDQINKLTKEAWNDCFYVTTRTGFTVRSEAPLQQNAPARVVVPIYFDSWPRTRQFVQSVSSWHEPRDFILQKYEQGIAEVQAEDDTGYAYYLAHAALFSGRGEWRTAAALCDQAIAVVSARRTSDSQANGREAHYLGGYCRRHTVKQARELEDLRVYVKRAEEIYKREKKSRPKLDAIGERFESEELSIDLTELMFDRYFYGEPKVKAAARASELLARILDLKARLVERIAALARNSGDRDAGRRIEAAKQLLGRINANILSLILSFQETSPVDRREFRESFAELAEYSAIEDHGGKEMARSLFIRSVLLAAGVVLNANNVRRRDIEEHFEKARLNPVFPYDPRRFAHWAEIALSRL